MLAICRGTDVQPIQRVESAIVVLPFDNVDTDQIVPARYLTVTTRDGMGAHLFADWRLEPDFVLNQPASEGASILVTGENFGCGSSREHAPWALVDHGFRAVVSTSIADIFKNNAVKNGLVPVEISVEAHSALIRSPGATIVIDVERRIVTLPDGSDVAFPLDGFARHCLLSGVDQLEFLMEQEDSIQAYESSSR